MIKITEEWDKILLEQFNSQTYLSLREFLKQEYALKTVYPPMFDIFNGLKLTPFNDINPLGFNLLVGTSIL